MIEIAVSVAHRRSFPRRQYFRRRLTTVQNPDRHDLRSALAYIAHPDRLVWRGLERGSRLQLAHRLVAMTDHDGAFQNGTDLVAGMSFQAR